MKILFIIFLNLWSFNSYAATNISGVANASNEVDVSVTTAVEIMAGISGRSICAADTDVFNSCQRGVVTRGACNFRTVCATTQLRITVTSAISGVMNITNSDNNVVHVCDATYTASEALTCVVPWSAICGELNESSCSTVGTETLKLGVTNAGDDAPEDSISIKFTIAEILNTTVTESLNTGASTDGVENYTLYPGDEKAYLSELEAVQDFTVTGAADIVGLRGFFAPGNCVGPTAVTTNEPSFLIDLTDDKSVDDGRVDEGLENGIRYLFMFGFEDEAGNIGLFKDLQGGSCVDEQHSVEPRDVFGLLEENQNCFISTAAYGSTLNPKVKTLRKFRDQILSRFSLGQKFIKFYYQNSPPIADKIRESKFLRGLTRALLWPVWAVSASVLYLGLMPFLFVVTMTLLSFVFLRNKSTKKKLLILFLIFSAQTSNAQDDFFSTTESTKIKALPKETAPQEPPYSGNENDEFSDLEESSQKSIEVEEAYEPDIEQPKSRASRTNVKESPDKWKPFQRVPDEKRLEELSEEGLMKITKKGGYNYKVIASEQKSAASLRVGVAAFPNLQNPTSGTYFSEIYGEDKKPVLLMDYEWQFFQSFGKLGIKIGSGIMVASGTGQLAYSYTPPSTGVPTSDAMEKYNFYMFPNSIAAIYRLDIFNKQWIVPFVEAGVDYLAFVEARDDGDDIKFGGSPHFHFAVGGSFLLDTLGKDMMTEIDKQYGVNHMWLTAEFRHLEAIGSDFDFSDDLINAGIMVEF